MPDFAPVVDHIHKVMAAETIPSFAIAVARDGEIIWEEGFGWANMEKRIPSSPHIMYSLASTTKPFATSGIMKLVEQGKLELDKPVNQYLPSDAQVKVWLGNPDDVTVRRVANHTAGLPRHENFFGGPEEIARKPKMEESIRRYGNTITFPGERYRYSNIGFGILDYLIERHSGKTWNEFMRREFFVPLGMTRSSVDIGPGLEQFAAERYNENRLPITFYDVDHRGASSIYCSVHDLALFGMFHLKQHQPNGRAPLTDETLDAMRVPTADRFNPLTAAPQKNPPASGYGIGWVVDDSPIGPFMHHAGGMGGTMAQLVLVPKYGIVIASAENSNTGLPHEIDKRVLPALLPECAEALVAWQQKEKPAAAPDMSVTPELLGDWRGTAHTYQKDIPFTLSFKPYGDVHAKLGNQLPVLVNDMKFINGWLGGRMAGCIETTDIRERRFHPYHHIQLDLKLRENRITGAAMQIIGGALSHWIDLTKVESITA